MEKEKEMRIVSHILEYCDTHDIDMDYYTGCAEWGYDDQPVLAANWNGPGVYEENHKDSEWGMQQYKNKQTLEKLSHIIDKMEHVSLEWSDEWAGCANCGKAVRTSPDSYSWQASWVWAYDSEIVCRECWEGAINDIIEFYHNNSRKALPSAFVPLLEKEGFTGWQKAKDAETGECTEYETGFHAYQNDNPKEVFKAIKEESANWEIVFVITGVGQFDISWTAYVRKNLDSEETQQF